MSRKRRTKQVRKQAWTPNEDDFCRCGGVFLRKLGECSMCGAPKTPDNRFTPGPHDYTPDELSVETS